MVMVKYGETEGYMDGYLKANLDLYNKMVKEERDLIFICSGKEGDGKTFLTAQILKYLDPTFNLDRCFMDGEEFIDAVKNAKEPFKAYMYDEGQEFTSRGAMTRFNKFLVQVLSRVRAKQLYIGICIPSFFELDRYPAIHRSNFLIQVYLHKGRRGYFKFYNWEKKKDLYIFGKKTYNLNASDCNFIGRFTNKAFPFDRVAYHEKKMRSIERMTMAKREIGSIILSQRNYIISHLVKNNIMTFQNIFELLKSKQCPLELSTIQKIINEKNKEGPL